MNPLRRVAAYRAIFLLPDGRARRWVIRLSTAMRLTFLNDAGEPLPPARIVLADLARFCCATKPTLRVDPAGRVDALACARMDGRREVFLWIQEHLHLDDRLLLQLQHEDQDDGR